jgi:hypothetical protein
MFDAGPGLDLTKRLAQIMTLPETGAVYATAPEGQKVAPIAASRGFASKALALE